MGNLNAEEVKKAHEHCHTKVICKGCPCLREDKKCTLHEDTLSLINSQEQRIKELAEANKQLLVSSIELEKQVERLSEKNERLTKGRFDFEELFVALEILKRFAISMAIAMVGATCLLLPIGLAINISWWYLFLYLVTIPILVGIILFLCYTKEEDRND